MTTGDNSLRGTTARTHTNDEGRRISGGWKKFDIGGVVTSEDGWS
jgi:hypothetical protein